MGYRSWTCRNTANNKQTFSGLLLWFELWPSTCTFACFNLWIHWLNSDETWLKCYATGECSKFFIVKFQAITQKHGKFKNWRWRSHSDHGMTSYGGWGRQYWRLPTLSLLFHFPLAPLGLYQTASSCSELIHATSF
jgi:hypothetical protein